jgi:hypothetical protein
MVFFRELRDASRQAAEMDRLAACAPQIRTVARALLQRELCGP